MCDLRLPRGLCALGARALPAKGRASARGSAELHIAELCALAEVAVPDFSSCRPRGVQACREWRALAILACGFALLPAPLGGY